MKPLDISKCKTNADACMMVRERIKEISLEDLISKVEEEFVFQEDTISAVYTGLSMNMNVFLSGPGGYGKSSIVKLILDIYKIPYSTIVGYKDMPVDALLGIPDMDKLLKSSQYEVNFKDSVFGKPFVLLAEEFTDILPSTAAAMKDILTEKGFRQGDEKVESLIASVVVTANKSANDISDDPSKKALYEDRFPIRADVRWGEYRAKDYFKLLKIKFKDEDERLLYFMAKLFETNFNDHGNVISPRIAIDVTAVYVERGITPVRHFNVNLEGIRKIEKSAELELKKRTVVDIFESMKSYISGSNNTVTQVTCALYALHKISTIAFEADNAKDLSDFRGYMESVIKKHNISEIDFLDKTLKEMP